MGKEPFQEYAGATPQAEGPPMKSSFCTPKSRWKSNLNPEK